MLDRNTTVGNAAALIPKAMDYFAEIGVDYCCGGHKQLSSVLREKGMATETVFSHLDQLEKDAQKQTQNFLSLSPSQLTEYMVNTHHTYLRRTLPQIGEYMSADMRAHGANHPELFQAGNLFGKLKADLEQHLIKEEVLLFPAIAEEEKGSKTADLKDEITGEHEEAGKLLEELRHITHNYDIPQDACETYRKVYQLLPLMEEDLHRHIHLENNILFQAKKVR